MKQVYLQSRDRMILRCCYEQQFLLTDHVVRYLFHGAGKREALRRIQELEQAGLVRREHLVTLGPRRVIRVTQMGIGALADGQGIEVPQVKRLDIRTLIHDATVTSVRLRLGQIWEAVWIPERALKSDEYPQIPDGVVLFGSGKKIAVEVENSAKGRERFMDLIGRWRGVEVLLVLYVTTSDALTAVVRNHLRSAGSATPFGLVSWSALKSSAPKVWTPRGEIDLFSRRSF